MITNLQNVRSQEWKVMNQQSMTGGERVDLALSDKLSNEC